MNDLLSVRVARKTTVAEAISAFELVPVEGDYLPEFTAGAHVDVVTPSGHTRQYSLCSRDLGRRSYRIAVLREQAGRGGSQSMHNDVHEGDLIRISMPRNHFALDESGGRSILFAGGIGITPILAMAYELQEQGRDFELHYCTRSAARTAFQDELSTKFAEQAHVYHDDGPSEHRLDLAHTLQSAPAGAHLYVCGPSGFIDAVLNQAKKSGWPDERVHREFFSAAPVDTSGDRPFEVVVASSGLVIPIAADQTVVEALAKVGVDVMTSCEQGVCGTCVTRILEGMPDHRDSFFTDAERAGDDQFTPCCSRARSARLVLDL